MIFKLRAPVAAALAVLVAAGVGLWLLADPDGATRRHVVVDGVPLDEVRPPGARLPGVVVAHGFAGSATLMAQFGDSLAARGFVVVLLDRPARLLLLVGALEFPGFRVEAERAAERSGGTMVVVPFVEHISILYAPRTHREIADWLGAGDAPLPSPFRRVSGATILLLALVAGLYPLARLLFGAPRGNWPRLSGPQLGFTVAVIALTGAAAVGFTSGFVLLVIPLLGMLLLWQAAWSAVLHRFAAPSWLISLVGSLIVAWPLATALPVIG